MPLLTLLPSLFLAAGAVAVRRPLGRFLAPRRWAGAFFVALATAASVALLWGVLRSEALELRQVMSPWSRSAFQASPTLNVDLLAASFVLVISLLTLLALLTRGSGAPGESSALLWVASAATLFAAAGRAPLGLVAGWLALDLSIVLALQGGRWALVAGQVGLLAAIMGLTALPPGTTGLSREALASATPTVRFWLAAAGFIRMGLYPFWWTVPPSRPYSLWASVVSRLAPMLCGLYLILRAAEITPYGQGLDSLSLLPALVAVVAGAVLAWLSHDTHSVLDWTAVHHLGLVFMAASLGGPMGMYPALVLLVDFVVSRAVLYAATGYNEPRTARIAVWLAAACALGLPPTIGFTGRWLLYRELLNYDLAVVLAVTVLASMLAAASLVSALPVKKGGMSHGKPVGALLLLASLLGVGLGVGFNALRPGLAILSAGYEPHLPWAHVLATMRYTANASRGIQLLGAIVGSAIIGLIVGRSRGEPTEETLASHRRRTQLLELNGAAAKLAALFVGLGGFLQRAAGRHEGRQDLAWTLLAVVAIGSAIISGQVRPDLTPPVPAPLTPLLLLGATAIAAILLLGRSPVSHLAALGAGYVFSSGLLALLAGLQPAASAPGNPTTVASIKLLGGVLVVGVLAISVAQAPLDRRLADTAARLLDIVTYERATSGRVLPAVALAMAVVVSFGIHAYNLPPEVLPDALLQPALILAAGAVLSVVFAVSSLHLAVGVLLAMIGFEMVYARLDPGLLVTGGLAALQLMFALVASYFVGSSSRGSGGS